MSYIIMFYRVCFIENPCFSFQNFDLLHHNTGLQHVDLSGNAITTLGNIGALRNLKVQCNIKTTLGVNKIGSLYTGGLYMQAP